MQHRWIWSFYQYLPNRTSRTKHGKIRIIAVATANIVGDKLSMFVMGKSKNPWCFNPLSANFTKWSNTLKQFVGKLRANCFSLFDHFVGLGIKGLRILNPFHINTGHSRKAGWRTFILRTGLSIRQQTSQRKSKNCVHNQQLSSASKNG